MLRQRPSSNAPIIRNDYTTNQRRVRRSCVTCAFRADAASSRTSRRRCPRTTRQAPGRRLTDGRFLPFGSVKLQRRCQRRRSDVAALHQQDGHEHAQRRPQRHRGVGGRVVRHRRNDGDDPHERTASTTTRTRRHRSVRTTRFSTCTSGSQRVLLRHQGRRVQPVRAGRTYMSDCEFEVIENVGVRPSFDSFFNNSTSATSAGWAGSSAARRST
jgi:hypothetical protein